MGRGEERGVVVRGELAGTCSSRRMFTLHCEQERVVSCETPASARYFHIYFYLTIKVCVE